MLASGAVVVIDDVNWKPVRDAFGRLARHERVSRAVAVGRLGIVITTGGATA